MSEQEESFKDWINKRIARMDEAVLRCRDNDRAKADRFNMRAFELEQVRAQLEKVVEDIDCIRLVDINCDPDDMRDKIIEMLIGKVTRLPKL